MANDLDIITQARAGDPLAFATLVRRYQDLAVGTAYGWLGDIELARDVAQETFISAHAELAQLREAAAFASWLKRIVLKHCDRLTRRRQLSLAPISAANATPDNGAGPAADYAVAKRTQHVRLAIAALPDQERMAVVLHYFAELSNNELALFLELPLSTIKQRLRSARRRLREQGEHLVQASIDALRPSHSGDFSEIVLFFRALRAGEHEAVRQLLAQQPALANAQQAWDTGLVYEGVLPFPSRATALITAIERDDLQMLTLLLDAGAELDGGCGCATGESPLWSATLLDRRDHVALLLARGADPNVVAATGNAPLHIAAMRGFSAIAEQLLASGADPAQPDRSDRTAAEWASANGHGALATRLSGTRVATATRPSSAARPAHADPAVLADAALHTGIKALDLLAPLPRNGLVRVPFSAGVGMMVLLGELSMSACRNGGAALWSGFAQRPFDVGDLLGELHELGLQQSVGFSVAGFDAAPEQQRAAFTAGVERALAFADAGRQCLLVLLASEGFEPDIDAELPRLVQPRTHGGICTLVVTPFPGREAQWSSLQAPYKTQIALDRARARRGLFPAVHPERSGSVLLDARTLGARHVALASATRAALAAFRAFDPEFAHAADAVDALPRELRAAHELLRFLRQPFRSTEPFTGRPGQQVTRSALLDAVEDILGRAGDAARTDAEHLGTGTDAAPSSNAGGQG